jgi:hypothetical protein
VIVVCSLEDHFSHFVFQLDFSREVIQLIYKAQCLESAFTHLDFYQQQATEVLEARVDWGDTKPLW